MNPNKMKNWHLILISLGILILPLVINFVILLPKFFPVVGDGTNWLSFWAGYTGSIVTAGIAMFVLWKQLKQNHEENEDNRQLQLNLLEYQQQTQWINSMREACIKNIYSYDCNDIINVTHIMQRDLFEAYRLMGDISSRLQKTDTEVIFIGRIKFDYQKTFHEARIKAFKEYVVVINDMKRVILHLFNKKDFPKEQISAIKNDKKISDNFKTIFNSHNFDNDLSVITNVFHITEKYFMSSNVYFNTVREFTLEYLAKEQEQIDKILTNDTER